MAGDREESLILDFRFSICHQAPALRREGEVPPEPWNDCRLPIADLRQHAPRHGRARFHPSPGMIADCRLPIADLRQHAPRHGRARFHPSPRFQGGRESPPSQGGAGLAETRMSFRRILLPR
jgi:hypothetical protein